MNKPKHMKMLLLALAVTLVSSFGVTAFAATPSAPEAKDPALTQAASTQEAQENGAEDPNEDAALAIKASVTAEQAIAAAQAAYPDYAISANAVLNDENGSVVYGITATDKTGKAVEIKVDANSCMVLSLEAEED